MRERPVGTVTFLFTDIEGSTRGWETHPAETRAALQRRDEIVTRGIEAHDGVLILERGEGDSVFAVFARASDAVAAACAIQSVLRKEAWPQNLPMRVRMAIHTGEADATYRGPHVNRAARIRAIAHGEQVLISGVTEGIVHGTLPAGALLIDLGRHRLQDVSETEHVFQLVHPDLRADFPPLKSLSNFRQNLPVQLTLRRDQVAGALFVAARRRDLHRRDRSVRSDPAFRGSRNGCTPEFCAHTGKRTSDCWYLSHARGRTARN